MNPYKHALSTVKRYGGKVDDYLKIHELLDSPKSSIGNHTNRFATHNMWFCLEVIPKIFGYNFINSDGKEVDSTAIALQHVSEDFKHKFIPSLHDYLKNMNVEPWMQNGVKQIDNEESIQNAIDFKNKLNETEVL